MADEIQHGKLSYQCYEFQIVATVAVALDLMPERGLCQAIVVEPESDEDVEAELDVEPERAGAGVTPQAGQITLLIQIKHRGTPWTRVPFEEVLRGKPKKPGVTPGPARRIRPLERLADDSTLRFVLLTNAQLGEEVKEFSLQEIDGTSTAADLPKGIETASIARANLAKRIGALTGQTLELLLLRIGRILRERANVPAGSIEACTNALKELVRRRLLESGESRPLTLEQLWDIIADNGGVRPLSREMAFVPPVRFPQIIQRLEEEHGVVLTGLTGVGKTEAAEEIVYRLRTGGDKYELVRESHGIEVVEKKLRAPGRHVFYLADPWGWHVASEDAKAWRAAVPRFLARSSATKKIVVTSRSGVMNDALGHEAVSGLTRWTVCLDADDYPPPVREGILNAALVGSTAAQLAFARENMFEILSGVQTPQALVDLARSLQRLASPRKQDLKALIDGSLAGAVTQRFLEELRDRAPQEVGGAILLWIMQTARAELTDANIEEWRDVARSGGLRGEIEPRKLARWMHMAGWATVRNGAYVVHPTRTEGLEKIVNGEEERATDLLTAVLNGLVTAGRRDKIHALIRTCLTRMVKVPQAARDAADAFLLERWWQTGSYGAEEALRDLSELYSRDDVVRKLARALTTRQPLPRVRYLSQWQPPVFAPEEVEALLAASETCKFAQHFVRKLLPEDNWDSPYDPERIAAFFAQFGCDLDDAFLDAAATAMEVGGGSVKALVQFALRKHDSPFEQFIDSALAVIDTENQPVDREVIRREEQGEANAVTGPDEAPPHLLGALDALETAVASRRVPVVRRKVSRPLLVTSSQSLQGDLAGPSLLALGLAGPTEAEVSVVRGAATFTVDRDILLRAGWILGGNDPSQFPGGPPKEPSHPGHRFISHVAEVPGDTKHGWNAWLSARPEISAWISKLPNELDVAQYVRVIVTALSDGAV